MSDSDTTFIGLALEDTSQQIVSYIDKMDKRTTLMANTNIFHRTDGKTYKFGFSSDGDFGLVPTNVSDIDDLGTDANLKPENIKDGVSIYGITGNYVSTELVKVYPQIEAVSCFGMPNGGAFNKTEIVPGYIVGLTAKISGSSYTSFTIGKTHLNVDTQSIPFKLTESGESYGYIKQTTASGVTVSITEPIPENPMIYYTIFYVPAELDKDLVPENIKSGVDIFGITGTYEGGAREEPIHQTLRLDLKIC